MRLKDFIVVLLIAVLLIPLTAGGGNKGTTIVIPPWNHCLGLHKVSQFHLDIYSGYKRKFNNPQGLFCTKLKCKDNPDNPADDDELTVYGINSGNNEIIYNKSLTSIGIVDDMGPKLGRFNHPISLTGDSDGNLFVADTGNDRIVHMKYINDELIGIKEIRLMSGKAIPLKHPSGISLSGGRLFIADTDNDRIVITGTDGRFIKELRPIYGSDTLFKPYTISAISNGDEWYYYRDFFIAVIDSLGKRLWKLRHDGSAVRVVHYDRVLHGGRFNHVAIDYYGNVYVTDKALGMIHKFDRHLNFIISIGDSQFDEPRGIAIYRRFGQIFISERAGAQYYWIGTDVIRFRADSLLVDLKDKRVSFKMSFLLTEYSEISLKLICRDNGDEIPILNDFLLPPGFISRKVSFSMGEQHEFANCNYIIELMARPTYSSKAYHSVTRKSRTLIPVIN